MDNTYFVVETALVDDNRKLKSISPDKDGFFNGIPLAGLGIPTQNKTQYSSESLINSITNNDSVFNKRLKSGDLFGEYGHPYVSNLNDQQALKRILTLEPLRKSVFFKKIYSKRMDDLGIDFIFGDIKPAGPFGKYAEEALLDPNMNFSTSLRAITNNRYDRNTGISHRTVLSLATFDVGVPGGGFKESSKRYTHLANEDLCEMLSADNLLSLKRNSSIAFESLLTDTELNSILKQSKISIKGKVCGYFLKDENLIYDEKTGEKRSILSVLL